MDALLSELLRLVQPLGLLWVSLLVLAIVSFRRRRRKLAAVAGALWLLLQIFGATSLPEALLRRLERPYAGVDFRTVEPGDAVVMLGGGISPSRMEAGGFHLTEAGDRVLMALELVRLRKAPVLVLGGGAGLVEGRLQLESELLRDWMKRGQWTAEAEVLSLARCHNTHDEALQVRALAAERGWKRVLLVTSATHMRRASATFAAAGVPVRPVPCNFLSSLATGMTTYGWDVVPSPGGFAQFAGWMHETVGWYEYRRRGWL